MKDAEDSLRFAKSCINSVIIMMRDHRVSSCL